MKRSFILIFAPFLGTPLFAQTKLVEKVGAQHDNSNQQTLNRWSTKLF